MRVSTRGQPEYFGYFAWAFEGLPALSHIAGSLTPFRKPRIGDIARTIEDTFDWEFRWFGPDEILVEEPLDDFVDADEPESDDVFSEPPPRRYLEAVGYTPWPYLEDAETYFGADLLRVSAFWAPRVDATAYRLMLKSFLMAFMGQSSIGWLGVLMLRGSLDRQFTITRFLHLMTDTNIPGHYDRPPSRQMVIHWAQAISQGEVGLRGDVSLAKAIGTYQRALRRTGGQER